MNRKNFNQRAETTACLFFVGVLLAYVYFYATAPISDPDFWWHLKSGEIMVQQGGLLQADPFNFTGDDLVSNIEAVILKGYWMWQLTAYGLYSLLGFNGIFLLNFITLLAMVGVLVQQMHRQRLDYPLAIALITLCFFLMRNLYLLERPQIVSFLFAAILLGQLAKVRNGGMFDWKLPVLMGLWANLHGGFIVGDILLFLFISGAVIEYRQDLQRFRHILLWGSFGIAASLVNPNGALVFGELMTFNASTISEFQSTWVKFQQGFWWYSLLWLLIVFYGVGIWKIRRYYWPELFIALFLAYFSVTHVRNVAFFAFALLPAIGLSLQQGDVLRLRRMSPLAKVMMVLLSAAVLLWQMSTQWQKQHQGQTVHSYYPAESSNFILNSGLEGRMLNSYNFGGYQLWRFYPRHLVFIDGRGLDPAVFRDWKLMASASLQEKEGRKEYEVLLDRYAIDFVVQPHIFHDTGRLTPLLKFLLVKPDWIPIYVDTQCFILVRNSPKNATVINRYKIDKREFNNKIIGSLIAACKVNPKEITGQIALTEMLIFVGRYTEAEDRLVLISQLQPDNPDLASLRNQIAVLKNSNKP